MPDTGSSLLVSLEEGVLHLVLNRPRRLNALDADLIDRLERTLREHSHDQSVRALIVSGGRRAFCFGADLGELASGEARALTLDALLPRYQALIVQLTHFPAPTLAAISGFAAGAGLDLALACDLRIAAAKAKLAVAFIGMGLVPDGGGTHRLPRLIGLGRAFAMLYGEPITAEQAARIGLVNRVVPQASLEQTALDLARSIAALPSGAVRAAKKLLLSNCDRDLEGSLAAEAVVQSIRFRSAEFEAALTTRGLRGDASGP